MKLVESALYASKIPGVVPHRHDNRTIKIPIPKYVFSLCCLISFIDDVLDLLWRLVKNSMQ